MASRRAEDKSIVLRVWRISAPYFHIVGWIVVVTFLATTKWNIIESYASEIANNTRRIEELEKNDAGQRDRLARIEQKIDDMIQFLHRVQ